MRLENFCVVLDWEKGVEKIYEYVISNCCEFFEVNNQSYLIFKIIPFEETHQLYIGLFNEDALICCYKFFDELDYSKLKNTGLKYESIKLKNVAETRDEIISYKGKPILKENEIRYLNINLFDMLEILSKILTELVSNKIKEKNFFTKIFYDHNVRSFKFFVSDDYKYINSDSDVKKFKDITPLIENKFL